MRIHCLITSLALIGCGSTHGSAREPTSSEHELRVWTTRAIATVLAVVGREFERTSGYTLRIVSDLPPAFARRTAAGDQLVPAARGCGRPLRHGSQGNRRGLRGRASGGRSPVLRTVPRARLHGIAQLPGNSTEAGPGRRDHQADSAELGQSRFGAGPGSGETPQPGRDRPRRTDSADDTIEDGRQEGRVAAGRAFPPSPSTRAALRMRRSGCYLIPPPTRSGVRHTLSNATASSIDAGWQPS